MKKVLSILTISCFALVIFTGAALAATYDYSDATGYSLAQHQYNSWQRLGSAWNADATPGSNTVWEDASDDGVFWSIDGGKTYGHDAITQGQTVTFKFVMYKEMWGRHNYDLLKAWIDWDQDKNFADNLFYEGQWNFKTDSGDAGQAPTTAYAYGDGLAQIYKTFYKTITVDADAGDYWLRARVICNADINSNNANLTPYGSIGWGQGEIEDWKFTVKQVPEPASLLLFGLGLLGLAGVRRKMK